MSSLNRLVAASLFGLGLLSAAHAASLSGRVQDANTKAYLYGATVTIRELDRSTATTSGGEFYFADVAPGTYTVAVSYLGYEDSQKSVVVSGTGETRADLTIGSEVVTMGQFVVEGNREGQARALQQKRVSDSILDVVAADNVGKLPDGNAAEAVRRLPGVFAEIDQNEGRYIVVRGIDANLNNVTLNGVNLGSSESGGRGAAMDSIPADLISRIEVIKAVTPDMDAQAIGASVNIVTTSAFDRGEPFFNATLAGGYFNGPRGDFEQRKLTPYSGSATYGTTFGDGKWGIVLGASYSFRHYISNRRSGGNPWYPAGPDGSPGADIFFPAEEALFHYDVQRWRQGLNAALEYKPSADSYYALRVSDNRFMDEEGREQNSFEFWRTTYPTSFTPTSAVFANQGRSTVEYRFYRQKHNYTNVAFEGKNALADGSYHLDYTLAVGNAEKQTPDRQDWEFRSSANLTSSIDTSKEYWTIDHPANFYDAATFPFRRVRLRRDSEEENNGTAELNLKRDTRILDHEGFWQVGAKYFTRDKSWDRQNADYVGAKSFRLSEFGLSSPPHEMFGGSVRMSPQINLHAAHAFYFAHPDYFGPNTSGTTEDSLVDDFDFSEDISAAYAMAKADFGQWSVLAGVRVESSTGKVTQTEFPTLDDDFQGVRYKHFKKTYTNVLPGVHLKFTPKKNWVIRAAWTNTLGRPNYPDMAAASVASFVPDDTGSTYSIDIEEGNPDLKPYESMNFDLTSEYYFANSGIFSVSGFYKDVDNPVFTNQYTLRNGTYEGFNYSSLHYEKPQNADSGKIKGVEFNYQQQLTMLPSPFDGLGFSVNYTIADSEEHLFSRPDENLRFTKQANDIYNIAVFYEKYRIQARVAYTFTGDFVKEFGGNVNEDMYQAERRIIDAKISYRINRHFSVFADVINLGEEPLDEYTGVPSHNGATEDYWWTANFGVNINL